MSPVKGFSEISLGHRVDVGLNLFCNARQLIFRTLRVYVHKRGKRLVS